MKRIIIAAVIMCAATAFAAKPELPRDLTGQKIQGFAPDGTKSLALTVNSTTVDMSGDLAWQLYSPTACKYRMMPSAVKAGGQLTAPANANTERRVNSATTFLNLSGCTSGELQRQ